MREVVFTLPVEVSAAAVLADIGARLPLLVGPVDAVRCVHLDTFDWRLWRAGDRLVFEHTRGGGRLLWRGDGETTATVMPAAEPPVRGADLPNTLAGQRIATLIERRALLALGVSNTMRQASVVLDRRDKAVARLTLDQTVDLDAYDRPAGSPGARLRLEGLTGFDSDHSRVAEILRSELGLDADADDELARTAGARGRTPGDYSSKVAIPLQPDEPAQAAVRRMLEALLDTVVVNAPGASADLDPEFLHDLRVAVRRTRSLLGQLKRSVPARVRERLDAELRWLGSVTGPVRDLDVYLIELDGIVGEAELAPFLELLHKRRERARHDLVEAIAGNRFARVVADWRAASADPFAASEAPDGGRRVAEVARKRIRSALARVMNRGSELGPDSPLPAFHRLRIDAKKLRYLLELFAALFPEKRTAALVKVLKRLQDVLGGLQDVAVQRTRLAGLAEEMAAASPAPAATLLAMGRLTVELDTREASHRAAFRDVFARFDSAERRARWAELLESERTR